MPEVLGAAIDRDSEAYRYIAAIIAEVGRLSGLPSRWNGHVREELDPRWDGSANEDGTLGVGESEVLARLRKAASGATLDAEDAALVRNAVAVVAHEAMHLSTRHPDPREPGSYPPLDPPEVALDEGLTELWTRSNVDNIMDAVGLGRYVEQAAGTESVDPYPAHTAAARALIAELYQITGKDPQDLTRDLLALDPAQRWDAITDLLSDHYLDGVEAPPDLEHLRHRLAGELRSNYARVHAIQTSNDALPKQTSDARHAARLAVASLAREVEEAAEEQRAAAWVGPAFQVGRDDGLGQLRNVLAGQRSTDEVAQAPDKPPTAAARTGAASRPARGWVRGG
jgi:hypothetical protein